MSFNQCTFIGNLGRDPEVRTFANGGQVANVSLACTEKWRDKSGEQQSHTEWVNLVFADRLAEVAERYLKKGDKILAQGRLRTRKWQGQDGQDRYTTEVRVDKMQMLGGRSDDSRASSEGGRSSGYSKPAARSAPAPARAPSSDAMFDDIDDDIPF